MTKPFREDSLLIYTMIASFAIVLQFIDWKGLSFVRSDGNAYAIRFAVLPVLMIAIYRLGEPFDVWSRVLEKRQEIVKVVGIAVATFVALAIKIRQLESWLFWLCSLLRASFSF
ncbi:MAG: hypothetical protein AAFV88_01730 [Planctomycetota bacterium]